LSLTSALYSPAVHRHFSVSLSSSSLFSATQTGSFASGLLRFLSEDLHRLGAARGEEASGLLLKGLALLSYILLIHLLGDKPHYQVLRYY